MLINRVCVAKEVAAGQPPHKELSYRLFSEKLAYSLFYSRYFILTEHSCIYLELYRQVHGVVADHHRHTC